VEPTRALRERDRSGRYARWSLDDDPAGFECDVRLVTDAVREAFAAPVGVDAVADERVSAEALALARAGDVSDLRTNPELSTCLAFHTGGLPQSRRSERVDALRSRVDTHVETLADQLFGFAAPVSLLVSGHFWYPAGSSMGWHTNSRVPGWRVYLTYSARAGRGFFRYVDPVGDRIVTSEDGVWDLRLFEVSESAPFWH
jgi:hypothetical protein